MQGGERRDKWKEITNSMVEENIDIFFVTETHLKEEDQPIIERNFGWIGQNRYKEEKKGGGVGIVYKEKHDLQIVRVNSCEEHIWCKI